MTKLIIDTNIYLNFYRLDSGQSLEMINELNKLLKVDNKFELILPKQIEEEFLRNKNSNNAIHADHILNFKKGLEVELKTPHLIKSSKNIDQIKKLVKKLSQLKEKAVKDYENRVFNPRSKINQQLKKLFTEAIHPNETNSVLQLAWFRTLRGNPPRKNNSSFGDAIIWETILDQFTDEDLILISGDGDFESEIRKGELNELLISEWSKKTKKQLKLYTKLGSFINDNIPSKTKPIKEETIKEEGQLNAIYNFSTNTFFAQSDENKLSLLVNQSSIVPPVNAWEQPGINWWKNNNKCSCCGAEINKSSKDLSFTVYLSPQYYCENCKDAYIISGQNCNTCGRHFHRNPTDTIFLYSFDNYGKCNDCIKKLYKIL